MSARSARPSESGGLGHDDSGPNDTASAPSRGRALALMLGVFAVLYAVDQVTKWLAVDRLSDRTEHPLLGDLLVLHLTRTPGAAFSTGTEHTELFTCVAAAAVVFVLWLSLRVRNHVWAIAFGLLLAGVSGNLTDRLARSPAVLRGHVVDFLELPHWPIFNVADICIDVAAVLILVQALRGVRLDGTRVVRHRDEPGSDEPDTPRS
jgi:signal peptidase II